MKLTYSINIESPEEHYVDIKIMGEWPSNCDELCFYLPVWSPGSYLVREYSKNLEKFEAKGPKNNFFDFDQRDKNSWVVKKSLKDAKEFEISYRVYCHELTVRTSHMDASHAFLHGPSLFMGIEGQTLTSLEISVQFPPCWSKISTALKDISSKREEFLYFAEDFDELLDSPMEIGCHETDGFLVNGIPHELAFYGHCDFPHDKNLKEDIKKIVEIITSQMKDIPYERYVFIVHFVEGLYGGLEHLDSTVVQFSPLDLCSSKGYQNWLELISHEFFHTWNVKRIRPIELGPFDYTKENYTRMHWLTEGLTSFMDQLFVLRSELATLPEYLDKVKADFNRYLQNSGRRYQTLEESSFNAWVKFYRPDENSKNATISYYLKGGIAFFLLNISFYERGKSINDFLDLLWKRYLKNPKVGVTKTEVLKIIEELSSIEVSENFDKYLVTTEEWDFFTELKKMGLEIVWDEKSDLTLGVTCQFPGNRVIVQEVASQGSGFKSGLNVGDEILAIGNVRMLKDQFEKLSERVKENQKYSCLISRNKMILNLDIEFSKAPRLIKEIKIQDEKKVRSCLWGNS